LNNLAFKSENEINLAKKGSKLTNRTKNEEIGLIHKTLINKFTNS